MTATTIKSMNTDKLLFPDALYDLNSISCASFLYFDKREIGITLHPTVSVFMTGCDPLDFCEFVDKKNPSWSNSYFILHNLWIDSITRLQQTELLLKNLHDLDVYKSIWLVYAKTEEALDKAEEFISTLGIPYEELIKVINLHHAAQELMAHLHFEKFLELYGSPSKKPALEFIKREVDYKLLFNYCNTFFNKTTIEKALVRAYFFRLITLNTFDRFMLSNELLIPLLSKLANTNNDNETNQEMKQEDILDVVSWEVFRQIVSPYLDEKEGGIRVSLTADMLLMRNSEIKRLKNKCLLVAESFKSDYNLPSLRQSVSKHVAMHVEKDVQDLLALDKEAYREIRDKIFSDEKTWLALLTFISSLYTGGELIAAGSGLAIVSNVFAKAYNTKSSIKKAITKSDYALLYRIKKAY